MKNIQIINTSKKYNSKDYNIEKIRRNNVTSEVQRWYDFIIEYGFNTNDIDPMLYAIEFQYRNHNRYDSSKLPNLKDNIFAEYPYYFILPPYSDSNPYDEKWTGENQEKNAVAMMEYLLKTIKKNTVLKWQKPEEES